MLRLITILAAIGGLNNLPLSHASEGIASESDSDERELKRYIETGGYAIKIIRPAKLSFDFSSALPFDFSSAFPFAGSYSTKDTVPPYSYSRSSSSPSSSPCSSSLDNIDKKSKC